MVSFGTFLAVVVMSTSFVLAMRALDRPARARSRDEAWVKAARSVTR